MPLYDYQCDKCSHEDEHLQSINDARLTICPECNQESYHRKASAPSFTFKGGGWYKDLYGSAKSGSKSKKTESAGSSSTSTSTDSKKAATAQP